MKKTKILLASLALALFALTATSCNKEVSFESMNTRVMQNEVYWNQWRTEGNHLAITFDWDAITTDVLNYGTVDAYVYEGSHQCPLPYAYPMGQVSYDDGTFDYLVEQLRFDVEPGKITFIMQDLDGNLPEGLENSAPLTFRAVATVPVQYVID